MARGKQTPAPVILLHGALRRLAGRHMRARRSAPTPWTGASRRASGIPGGDGCAPAGLRQPAACPQPHPRARMVVVAVRARAHGTLRSGRVSSQARSPAGRRATPISDSA